MFRRKTRYDRRALKLTKRMSEQEKIESRGAGVVAIALQRTPVHVMAATQESATRHAEFFARIGRRLEIEIGQLPAAGSDAEVRAAYKHLVLVGPIDEFIANFDRGLASSEVIALVEGEPPEAAEPLLSAYDSVRLS